MLTKEVVIDKIEILEDGTIQTREETRILEDDKIISRSYTNREVIEPGDDFSTKTEKVKDVATLIHTKEVIDKFKLKKEKLLTKILE
jgi:hypothetical protein